MNRAEGNVNDGNTSGPSSEGVFDARAERVAALIELGTSGEGLLPSNIGSPAPVVGSDPSIAPGSGAAGAEQSPEVPGYRIIGKLGEGGMGTVWRAVQLSTRREVALKLVGSVAIGSHRARLRFEREVELAAKLEHP